MKEKIIVTGTGDSLFVADIPKEYFDGDFKSVYEYINGCDVKITNLETNISHFGKFANAYSGGTWLNTEPEVFEHLTRFGFNYYGTANNHCMDYSYHGLLSTIDELDKRGLAHSGTGRSLEEASAPAILNIQGKKVAIFAILTEAPIASQAGLSSEKLEGRPGVNYLNYNTYYSIDEQMLEHLKEIEKATQINAKIENSIANGFALSNPDDVYNFCGLKFCLGNSKKRTECDKKDLKRLTDSISKAKNLYDMVFVLIHCHEVKIKNREETPEFLEELAHACIDAGASAMIGGGIHQLRGIEIYKGCPIFYSLGDFIYQGMRVPVLPPDFMLKYGCDINAPSIDGLMSRSKNNTIGLQVHKCNFMTVLPKMEFVNGKLVSLEMMPIVAGFKREGKLDGLPYHAKDEECEEIFDSISRLSRVFGTKIIKKENMLKVLL